jgi:putative ABC transport system substrate-binding protein
VTAARVGRGPHRGWRVVPSAIVLLAAVIGLSVAAPSSLAQSSGKIYRVGFIVTSARETAGHLSTAFTEGLKDLGYVEGKNVVVERRFAGGKQEQLASLAAELVRLKMDVIVTGSNVVVTAVKQQTVAIPIVMAVSRDPVGSGFIASFAHPGGNITGLANDPGPEIFGKNLELLKEAVPRVSRVAVLWNPVPAAAQTYRNAIAGAASRLGVPIQVLEIRAHDDVDGAFVAMIKQHADGLVVQQDPVLFAAQATIVRLAARHRLPAIYPLAEFVDHGGLMSYGVSLTQQFRKAAVYVDKILKGAKPADLAVEQAAEFEVVINLNAAKALGLTIPPSLTLRATRVIE